MYMICYILRQQIFTFIIYYIYLIEDLMSKMISP